MDTSDTQNRSKINRLIQSWPRGTVAVQGWLDRQSVSRHLAKRYCATGWLTRLAPGAYGLAGDEIGWAGVLYAMQSELSLPIHVGGRSALDLQGYAHYLPLGRPRIDLSATSGIRLPRWVNAKDWGADIFFTASNLFGDDQETGFTDYRVKDFKVRVSTPERAILEALSRVPENLGFDEANMLMEGLPSLRSVLVQSLLEKCRQVKTKRLFLYFADAHQHSWITKLDLSNINLGHGKRVIIPGGRLDAKYSITVPRDPDETLAP